MSEHTWLDIYYDRDGRPITGTESWALRFADPAYKFVAKTMVGDAEVSTVWLGMNHAYTPDEPPLIFETMVFGGRLDQEMERYSTEEHALAGHDAMVRKVRGWRFWQRPRDVLAERIEATK